MEVKDYTLEQLHASLQQAIKDKDAKLMKFFKNSIVRHMKEYYGI